MLFLVEIIWNFFASVYSSNNNKKNPRSCSTYFQPGEISCAKVSAEALSGSEQYVHTQTQAYSAHAHAVS